MKPLEEIDPELFIYELYDSYGLMSLEGWELAKYSIGYCDAGRLYVRPKSGYFALMCELPDGNRLWFHVNNFLINSINERRKMLGDKNNGNKASDD